MGKRKRNGKPEQLRFDLEAGRARRDAGMQRALDASEPDAKAFAWEFAKGLPGPWLPEVILAAVQDAGLDLHPNAMGGLVNGWKRRGLIREVDRAQMEKKTSNGRSTAVYIVVRESDG